MAVLFESVKLIFFLFTIAFGMLLLKGKTLLPTGTLEYLHTLLMPGYLVLCGILVGYFIYLVRSKGVNNDEQEQRISVQCFIIGIMLGIVFALAHTFVL